MANPEGIEAATRIAKRLHAWNSDDNTDRRNKGIPRLLLSILAEELRIHRLHLEERNRGARQGGDMSGGHRGEDRDRGGRHGRRRHGECGHESEHDACRRRNRSHSRSRRRPSTETEGPIPGPYYMSDGAGSGRSSSYVYLPAHEHNRDDVYRPTTPPPERYHVPRSHTPSHGRGRSPSPSPRPHAPTPPPAHESGHHHGHRRRRRRRPPSPSPPTYTPKLGLMLGFGTHVKNCIQWEVGRRGREAARKLRRENREKRKHRDGDRGRDRGRDRARRAPSLSHLQRDSREQSIPPIRPRRESTRSRGRAPTPSSDSITNSNASRSPRPRSRTPGGHSRTPLRDLREMNRGGGGSSLGSSVRGNSRASTGSYSSNQSARGSSRRNVVYEANDRASEVERREREQVWEGMPGGFVYIIPGGEKLGRDRGGSRGRGPGPLYGEPTWGFGNLGRGS